MVIIGLLAVVPIIMGFVVSLSDNGLETSEIDDRLIALLIGAAILPIITLTVATAALGNDLEDRTLSNLTLTPAARWEIILPKLAAAITIASPPILIGAIVSISLAYDGDSQAIAGIILGVGLAILAYSSLFLWLGLTTGRALGYGLMYIFLWEFLFTSFVPGVRFLSIRAYMIGIVRGVDDARFADSSSEIISLQVSVIVLIVVSLLFTALAIRRLRTMDVP